MLLPNHSGLPSSVEVTWFGIRSSLWWVKVGQIIKGNLVEHLVYKVVTRGYTLCELQGVAQRVVC